jgi:hypothetical protein
VVEDVDPRRTKTICQIFEHGQSRTEEALAATDLHGIVGGISGPCHDDFNSRPIPSRCGRYASASAFLYGLISPRKPTIKQFVPPDSRSRSSALRCGDVASTGYGPWGTCQASFLLASGKFCLNSTSDEGFIKTYASTKTRTHARWNWSNLACRYSHWCHVVYRPHNRFFRSVVAAMKARIIGDNIIALYNALSVVASEYAIYRT